MADSLHNVDLQEEMKNLKLQRLDFIDWETYFMGIACLVSNRSKDPSTQVGACIVNRKHRIVGQGYNGMPRGCSDDEFPWDKKSKNPLETKYFYVCHAEMNAIFNKNCADIEDCVMYSLLFPCNQCAKIIIQSGISEVVYLGDKNMKKPEAIASMRMFDSSGVKVRRYEPKCKGFLINFRNGVCEEGSPNFISHQQGVLSLKRENYLAWQDYFLAIAILVAKRSKCPTAQQGACIVNEDNCIVGQGYNGMPIGCSDDVFPWGIDSDDPLQTKYLYECHAELNAILNAGLTVKGCTIYSISFPCNECAKAIIQSGIKKVIYLRNREDTPELKAAQRMFSAVGVATRQHIPKEDEIFVDFNSINI